jgi:hypothetical protein
MMVCGASGISSFEWVERMGVDAAMLGRLSARIWSM